MADAPLLKPGSLGGLKTRKPSEPRRNNTMMIYGPGGTGKTTLGASACLVPEMSPVLHLNIENGAQVIENSYPDGNIEILDIETMGELQAVFTDLHKTDGAGYRTILVDNVTEAQQLGIDHILGTARNSVDFTEFDGASFSNGAWNRSSEQMRKMFRYFRLLPCTTIFLAWERDYSDNNVPSFGPSFTKTFGGEAPGLVNDVYRYTIKNGKRVLQTERTDRVAAKDRTGTLPAIVEEPTMQLIYDYWTGKIVKSNQPPQTEKSSGLKKAGK